MRHQPNRAEHGWQSPNRLRALAAIGALPSDSDEVRLRKAVLVLSSLMIACLASVWVATFAALGLWLSAAIPFAYQITSALGIYAFAPNAPLPALPAEPALDVPVAAVPAAMESRRISQLVRRMPVGFSSPLGALLFMGTRQAWHWLIAFVGLVAVSGAIDPTLVAGAPQIPSPVLVTFFVLNVAGITTAYVLLQYFVRAREEEQARSERLLLNALPQPIAARLKHTDGVIADACAEVTVLFADIVDFTPLSERLAAADVVAVLDQVFAAWDQLAARHGVEKIKTVGDAYMVAAGVPVPCEDQAGLIAEMALAWLSSPDER